MDIDSSRLKIDGGSFVTRQQLEIGVGPVRKTDLGVDGVSTIETATCDFGIDRQRSSVEAAKSGVDVGPIVSPAEHRHVSRQEKTSRYVFRRVDELKGDFVAGRGGGARRDVVRARLQPVVQIGDEF